MPFLWRKSENIIGTQKLIISGGFIKSRVKSYHQCNAQCTLISHQGHRNEIWFGKSMYRVFCFLMQFEWQNLVEVKFMLHYAVSVKSTVKILSNFVAFLENMNFTETKNTPNFGFSKKQTLSESMASFINLFLG